MSLSCVTFAARAAGRSAAASARSVTAPAARTRRAAFLRSSRATRLGTCLRAIARAFRQAAGSDDGRLTARGRHIVTRCLRLPVPMRSFVLTCDALQRLTFFALSAGGATAAPVVAQSPRRTRTTTSVLPNTQSSRQQ